MNFSPRGGLSWSRRERELFSSSTNDCGGLLPSRRCNPPHVGDSEDSPVAVAMEPQDNDEEQKQSFFREDLICGERECEAMISKETNWPESGLEKPLAIAPPPEFQDPSQSFPSPKVLGWIEKFARQLVSVLISEALVTSSQGTWAIECSQDCHPSTEESSCSKGRRRDSGPRLCWTPELPFSPGHHRPLSRGSLASSRLSISHNSLTVPSCKADDSSFITLAMSHDVLIGELTASEISDIYNVPFDSDIYAVPIDMIRPSEPKITPAPLRPKKKPHRKKKRHTSSSSETDRPSVTPSRQSSSGMTSRKTRPLIRGSAETLENSKRHSVPGSSSKKAGPSQRNMECVTPREPIHMTLQEVRQYLQNLYSSSSDSSERKNETRRSHHVPAPRSRPSSEPAMPAPPPPVTTQPTSNIARRPKKSTFITNIRNKKANKDTDKGGSINNEENKGRKCNSFSSSIKQTLCSIFRFRKMPSSSSSPDHHHHHQNKAVQSKVIVKPPSPSSGLPCMELQGTSPQQQQQQQQDNDCTHILPASVTSPEVVRPPFAKRALPPLPATTAASCPPVTAAVASSDNSVEVEQTAEGSSATEADAEPSMDFASSIEKVKDYGWYWGPISGETAEKILSSEPDGSFIVRDSSDHHYIFSLTFRLNGCVRHVRIEHDQGNFSFGSCTKFKSHTIVDFIENAVEHSRSGRYLFFLHRRPVLGPMRVQLLHPVSRFKQVQSLQHMCRFVILKLVRRDLIPTLPLPRRVIDYLSTPHYYAEQQLDESPSPATVQSSAASSTGSHSDLLAFVPHRPHS